MIYKHGSNIQCSTVADKMKLLCCNGNQIHLVTKILFLGQKVFVYQIWAFYVEIAEIETYFVAMATYLP